MKTKNLTFSEKSIGQMGFTHRMDYFKRFSWYLPYANDQVRNGDILAKINLDDKII